MFSILSFERPGFTGIGGNRVDEHPQGLHPQPNGQGLVKQDVPKARDPCFCQFQAAVNVRAIDSPRRNDRPKPNIPYQPEICPMVVLSAVTKYSIDIITVF